MLNYNMMFLFIVLCLVGMLVIYIRTGFLLDDQ